MKVIFVIVSMAGGGAERVISILANQFVKNGIETKILMTAGDTVAYQLDPEIELFCAGGTSEGSMKKRLQRISKMRRYLKKNQDGIIVSFGPGTSFFAAAAAAFLKMPFLISERNDPAACPHPFFRNLIYRRAERLIFQTEDARLCFPKTLRERGCVIANPVTADLRQPYCGEREKTVVAVGRLEPQKNYMLLLEAFSIFHQNYPEYTLHIYGKGSQLETLQKHVQQLEIENAVIWEGFRQDVLSAVEKAGMYVLSSDYEGISNALLEAMAIGLPVISTDCPIGGSKMCIQNGVNGYLVPCKDKAAFAEAMMKVAQNHNLAKKMGEEAAKIRITYSEQSIAEQWLEQIQLSRKAR